MTTRADVTVIGAGAWGTALASLLGRNGCSVCLWGRDGAQLAVLARDRVNDRYLPGHTLAESVAVETCLEAAVAAAPTHLVAVPSHAFREIITALHRTATGVLWATKGFDADSGSLLHETAVRGLPDGAPLAVLSGPTFAGEVARSLPSAAVLASRNDPFGQEWAARLAAPHFRVYRSDDLTGVQIGGAVKNVLAIAAGITDGLALGANARAALIARGLSEMSRLGVAAGGRAETFAGLAGLGDLVLTCTDDQSRNRRFGLALGQGATPTAASAALGHLVEGAGASVETARMAERLGVEMPICEQVRAVVAGERSAAAALAALLARDSGSREY